jgi:hypothetical protein
MQNRLGGLATTLLARALVGCAIVPDLLPPRCSLPAIPAQPARTVAELPPPAPSSVRAVVERVCPVVAEITNEQAERLWR